jgi:hypothetical protein
MDMLVRFLWLQQNTQHAQLRKRIYFSSSFRSFSLRSLWACGKAEYHAASTWWSKVTHFMAANQEAKRKIKGPMSLQQHALHDLTSSQYTPPLKGFNVSQQHHSGVTNLEYMNPWGTFQNQTMASIN